ncbi:hypothetical protein [Streptomyces canus]|uniref:hypothetical protein n=1 Tax=Streptomyces canus TaxID=58343 RepID=UPI0027D86B49|nr:hypothetical protein [Streptomyces canus]
MRMRMPLQPHTIPTTRQPFDTGRLRPGNGLRNNITGEILHRRPALESLLRRVSGALQQTSQRVVDSPHDPADQPVLRDLLPVETLRTQRARRESDHAQTHRERLESLLERLTHRRQRMPLKRSHNHQDRSTTTGPGHSRPTQSRPTTEHGQRKGNSQLDQKPDHLSNDLPLGLQDLIRSPHPVIGNSVQIRRELPQVTSPPAVHERTHRTDIILPDLSRQRPRSTRNRLLDEIGQLIQIPRQPPVRHMTGTSQILIRLQQTLTNENEKHVVHQRRGLDRHKKVTSPY